MSGRNSYSKTDTDATFMRMKEDHMKNGQLKPGYNIQISTENQFILSYSVHQNASDTPTFKPHLEHTQIQLAQIGKTLPPQQVADAAYGSEENYLYLEEKELEAYIKYNTYRKEQSKKWKQDPAKVTNLFYNETEDFYICPMGQRMNLQYQKKTKTNNGFESKASVYQAQRCESCPMRGVCFEAKGNRQISVNHQLNRLKQKAKTLLETEQGQAIYKQRSIDVEPTFGNIKWNAAFKRFYLRSIEKVNIEIGLLSLAQNFKKWAVFIPKYPSLRSFFNYLKYDFTIYYKIIKKMADLVFLSRQPLEKLFRQRA